MPRNTKRRKQKNNKFMEENKMNIIYNECLGNKKLVYIAFCEKDAETHQDAYSISIRDNVTKQEAVLRNFTSIKEKAIDFIESLVRNTVKPEFLNDIAEDYLLA